MQSGLSQPSLRAHAACRTEFSVEEVVDTSGQTKLIGWSWKAEREKEIRNRCSKTCQMNQHVNCRGCSCTVNSSTSNKYEQALSQKRLLLLALLQFIWACFSLYHLPIQKIMSFLFLSVGWVPENSEWSWRQAGGGGLHSRVVWPLPNDGPNFLCMWC